MAIKVTFTLDEATIERLQRAAGRLRKPKSEVVREAIREYEAKSDRLSETERQRLLQALDRFGAQPPARRHSDVEKELAEIRWVRRHGGRLHPSE
ncbi:MAG TPA: ribbon-helix-helix protein, CopG family [Terriglobales bacterium]|nr:ribbon-helix-helix protein, CopG family [Terriglobales bacterium]